MKYVIDTSVDIKTYVQERDSGRAVRLRDEYHQGVHELIAPDIFPTEMCNVLMILERAGKIRPGEAALFFRQFLSELPPLFAAVPCCRGPLRSPSSSSKPCTTVCTWRLRSAKDASWRRPTTGS
jgi:hypothetical protein